MQILMTDYPNEEDLERIRSWEINSNADLKQVFEFAFDEDVWNHTYGRISGPEVVECLELEDRYRVSTGGWSGNEDVIGALQENVVWWLFAWHQHTRGGHYVFRFKHD